MLTERPWGYADPVDRLRDWISANTGDLVLIANIGAKHYFNEGELKSQHGSLTDVDGLVPVGIAYPGATDREESKDNTLATVRAILAGIQADPIEDPTEARLLAAYFGKWLSG